MRETGFAEGNRFRCLHSQRSCSFIDYNGKEIEREVERATSRRAWGPQRLKWPAGKGPFLTAFFFTDPKP